MTIRYRVDLENTSGTTVASFLGTGDGFLSLRFTKSISDKGSYQLTLSGFDTRKTKFVEDALIRVYLDDRANNIEWTEVFTGIHKTFTDSMAANGRLTFMSFGPSLEEIIEKAYILYKAGTDQASKAGVASTIMYEYVLENVGSSATVANGRLIAHTNPITNKPDLAEGPTWTGSQPYKNLMFVLQAIREYSIEQSDQIDFRVNYLENYAFQFEAGAIGVDRTTTGLVKETGLNTAGNRPVIFSTLLGSIESFTRSKSRYNEAHVAIALGQGTGANRATATATNAPSMIISPISQREIVTNANQISAAAGLSSTAATKLNERLAETKFSAKPKRQQYILFRDYDVGDFITMEDETGTRYNRQIESATVNVSRSDRGLIAAENLRFAEN